MTLPAVARFRSGATLTAADDETLIDQFLRTDGEDVFEILVRRYRDKVFQLAVSILGRGALAEAEDATQEVFVVVLRQLKRFRRESRFSTWLYCVARNRIVDYRRRAQRRPAALSDEALRTIPDRGAADPQSAAVRARSRERLLRQVDRLSEPQRVVVYLHYWHEQSVDEISELLGFEPGTVKSHLWRARRRLALGLREDGPDA